MAWDHHAREKACFAAGFVISCLLVGLIVVGFFSMPAALAGTLKFSKSRAMLSDAIGRSNYGYCFAYMASEPEASNQYPQWYLSSGEHSLYNSPVGRDRKSVWRYRKGFENGQIYRAVANPYCGMATAGSARMWQYPIKKRLVFFDVRLFGDEAGEFDIEMPSRLVLDGDYGFLCGSIDMADALANRFDSSVYPAFSPFLVTATGSAAEIEKILGFVRGYLKQWPVLVTADEQLAAAIAEKDYKVIVAGVTGLDTHNLKYCKDEATIRQKIKLWIK